MWIERVTIKVMSFCCTVLFSKENLKQRKLQLLFNFVVKKPANDAVFNNTLQLQDFVLTSVVTVSETDTET